MITLSSILIGILLVFLAKVYIDLSRQTKLFYGEKQRRDAILASLSDGVVQYDEKKRIILMNPKAEEFLGVRVGAIEGLEISQDIWDLKPELRALVEIIYPELAPYKLARGGESFSAERGLEIHTSRPEGRFFVLSKTIENPSGKVEGYVKIIRDISHEQLLSKIKSEFVSVAAHQLRTPLAALKWSIRLLLDGDLGKLDSKHEDFLNRSYDIAERMIKLVNDLLDAARIEEGRFGYEFKEVDYLKFIADLLTHYEVTSKSKGVSLVFLETKDAIPPLYLDPERLSVALSNLIENSFRYTKSGGRIELKVSREGDYVKTTVADDGAGIPQDEQRRVFSKFFRASNAIRLETEGTGLGLFIVRNIVKRHGGEISFASEEGKGTTFSVLLPIKRELIPSRENPVAEESAGV